MLTLSSLLCRCMLTQPVAARMQDHEAGYWTNGQPRSHRREDPSVSYLDRGYVHSQHGQAALLQHITLRHDWGMHKQGLRCMHQAGSHAHFSPQSRLGAGDAYPGRR